MSEADMVFLSVTDKGERSRVLKTGGDVRTRLHGAALELFRERGYDRTTAAEIARRAGVTERTFFRHFPDKREVLFDGEAVVRDALTASIADAPADLAPLDTLIRAFLAFGPMLAEKRSYAKPRQEIISATPALHERELTKIAALSDALAAALMARGVPGLRATLAAQAGMAAFVHATLVWLHDPETGLGDKLDVAFAELKALLAESDERR